MSEQTGETLADHRKTNTNRPKSRLSDATFVTALFGLAGAGTCELASSFSESPDVSRIVDSAYQICISVAVLFGLASVILGARGPHTPSARLGRDYSEKPPTP